MLRSNDNGATWEQSYINHFLGAPFAGVAPGPGSGLLLKKGRYAGRIVYAGHHDVPTEEDVVWYSDDRGVTWTVSEGVVVVAGGGRNGGGDGGAGAFGAFVGFDEPQATELSDGTIFLSLRDDGSTRVRGAATSTDGGATFKMAPSGSGLQLQQPEGGVMQPVITLQNGTVVTARPDRAGREIMTVFASATDGQTWNRTRTMYNGPAAYSALCQASNGQVYIAFERDMAASDCSGESCSIWWANVNGSG